MMEEGKSKEIMLQAQKNIFGKMTSKKFVKMFIDKRNANILDNLSRFAKIYIGNKKESKELTKNIIKIIVKLCILYRNDQFDNNELQLALNFKNVFRETIMIAISFYEVEFSYDKDYITSYLFKCKEMLKELTKNHLTDKTLIRIDKIFEFFSNPLFLDTVFMEQDSRLIIIDNVKILIDGLRELLDNDF